MILGSNVPGARGGAASSTGSPATMTAALTELANAAGDWGNAVLTFDEQGPQR